jgi:hypothetical protein
MLRSFQNRIQQSAFEDWLAQPIYYDGVAYAPRSTVILTCIRDLRGFISSKGYVFRMDDITMAKGWAQYLFLSQTLSSFKGHFRKNPLGRQEDYSMYCDLFDSEDREPFEEMLLRIQDFDPSTYQGCKALASVFPFAWYYIDINNSSVTEIVDEMVEPSDSDEDSDRPKTRVQADPYLVDQANAASKYNRWD